MNQKSVLNVIAQINYLATMIQNYQNCLNGHVDD
jgi:hypothetical protein